MIVWKSNMTLKKYISMRTSLKANADIGKLNLLKWNVTWKHQNKVKIGNACIKNFRQKKK